MKVGKVTASLVLIGGTLLRCNPKLHFVYEVCWGAPRVSGCVYLVESDWAEDARG
jgi:hypothetical protein